MAALVALAIWPLAAARLAAQSDRAKQFGMKIKCMCRGCDMSAGGCSHPGGAFSGPCSTAKDMMNKADGQFAKGLNEEQVMKAFVAEYGAIVYMEPPKQGFGLVAWVMPIFYAAAGFALVFFVIGKWRKKPGSGGSGAAGVGQPVTAGGPGDPYLRARAQADRETDD